MLLATVVASNSFANKQYYTKSVTFPEGATLEQKVDIASRLRPADKQLDWQRLELTAFLHFGVNTYTNREWGDGTESPEIFNPVGLDARQWVKTLHDAGFKLVILTAKHHDGFCLWQTKTTKHSVASSPWRNGKGDVLADLRKACDEYGMKLGVYLSPWDRNAACYGTDAYNDMFVAQLTELLTQYGKIDEVWFDGACGEGPNGKKQVYDWTRFKNVIADLQPTAVTAIMGDDVRWVGNEKGLGRDTEWSATPLMPGIYTESTEANSKLGLRQKSPDLGSRDLLNKATALYWWPSEVDVSIRPGWFYHKNEYPKPLSQLVNIYLSSVGKNSVLLLNIPPTTDGRIASADSARLMELRRWADNSFADDLVSKLKGKKNEKQATLRKGSTFNCVVLGEDISKGQRVESFDVLALQGTAWNKIAEGTTIGNKRILTFDAVTADAIKLVLTSTRGDAIISNIGVYNIVRPEDIHDTASSTVNFLSTATWKCLNHPEASSTFDHESTTSWTGSDALIIDMGRTAEINGFSYLPVVRADNHGLIFRYEFYVSNDGEAWTKVSTPGEFGNIQYNPLQQFVTFDKTISCRYFKFVPTGSVNVDGVYTIAELGITTPTPVIDACDNEALLWPNAGEALTLKPGDAHPTQRGWNFFTAHEFLKRDCNGVLPKGWIIQMGAHAAKNAKIDLDKCSKVTDDGYLKLWSVEEADSIDNGFGKKVKHSTFAYRTALPGAEENWCNFTENMRIEVRYRRSNATGFINALWLMGNNNRPWPKNGEIDLLENPTPTINHKAHFTLHSENRYAGVVGGKGSVTASTTINDMSKWNIYWMEWLEDRIIGGVNGQKFFEHRYGDDGNNDWPWNDPEYFYMLITSELSTNPNAWAGAIDSSKWNIANPPHCDIDWVRVFVNDKYTGPAAPDVKYY